MDESHPDVSSEDLFDDDSDEVSLLEVDQGELARAVEEAGISIKVEEGSGIVEVEVVSDDVSTFLILAPEEECTGAKVQGFIPREDGGISALEMHGQLVEGDVLTHLNGSNARLLEFSDILKACRGPERGGLPRPLVMRFSRAEALSVPPSPAPSPSSAKVATDTSQTAVSSTEGRMDPAAEGVKADSAGPSSLLEDLIGGLSLPGFAAGDHPQTPAGNDKDAAAREGGERHRMIPGMAHIKGVFRAELQAQGMLGGVSGSGDSRGGVDDGSLGTTDKDGPGSGAGLAPGEGLLMNVLRRLENIDVLGEDTPPSTLAATSTVAGHGQDGGVDGNSAVDDISGSGGFGQSKGKEDASAVASSLAGVGAKLRSRFRKPGGFGLQGVAAGAAGAAASGAPGSRTDVDGGNVFVDGASKALATNRERVMGWMKELRPKDWSPKDAEREVAEEAVQELRGAVRRLYLDAPDPALHTSMIVARAKTGRQKPVREAEAVAVGNGEGADRVIGTGSDKGLVKLTWYRSSASGGFAEIRGVDGPYYQPSADDVGMRVCVKCTLTEKSTPGVLSPLAGADRRGRGERARGGQRGGYSNALSPSGRQAQISFAEVGPIVLDPRTKAEVDELLAEEPAVFTDLFRRDVPGEIVRVRVEVGKEEVLVLAHAPAAVASPSVDDETTADTAAETAPENRLDPSEPSMPSGAGDDERKDTSAPGDGDRAGDGDCQGDDDSEAPAADSGEMQGGPEEKAEQNRDLAVLARARYEESVLVRLESTRPTVLRLTLGTARGGDGGSGEDGDSAPGRAQGAAFILGAKDLRQRDVLALTLRSRRQAALGEEVGMDDYPEETEAQQLHEEYLELKAAAAHFAKAYDEDDVSVSKTSSTEDDDGNHEARFSSSGSPSGSGSVSGSGSDSDNYTSEDEGNETEVTTDGEAEGDAYENSLDNGVRKSRRSGGTGARASEPWAAEERVGQAGGVELAAAPWETEADDAEAASDEPRSLGRLLGDLRQARAIADTRGRLLEAAHAGWEAGEAARERAQAELSLVSSELDLLRPLSRMLASRAEGKEAAEERADALNGEVSELKRKLVAATEAADKLGSRAGAAEDEAGATAGKLSGLEKVVRRLGGEAEMANTELATETAAKEEALSRASRAERELDQARAKAAVLDNRIVALDKEKLGLQAEANAFKARADAIEEKFSSARAAEVEALTARLSEVEALVSSLEKDNNEAAQKLEEALSREAEAEARAREAVQARESTSAELAAKTEQVMQLTAQRNSAKNRADSLAKDLSRVCGGGRTVDQIEVIVTRYADLKVQMAMMKAEQDGALADLHDDWQSGSHAEGGKKSMADAAKRALRENTELHGRIAAMTETLQMRAHQLEGQRQSNEFLLKRVEELERQIASASGDPGAPAVGTD